MADNKNIKKSSKTSSKSVNSSNTVENIRRVEHDYTAILNKILLCLYVVIFVLVINTMVLILKDSKVESNTSETETTDESEYDVSMFKEITADTLKEQTAGNTLKIVYIGRSTCGYCVKFLPTLQQAQEDYGYETLYLDITTVTTDNQSKILELDNEDGFLAENFGSTPMVLLMKNSEIVDTWIGYDTYSSYAQWLEKNGFEK